MEPIRNRSRAERKFNHETDESPQKRGSSRIATQCTAQRERRNLHRSGKDATFGNTSRARMQHVLKRRRLLRCAVHCVAMRL